MDDIHNFDADGASSLEKNHSHLTYFLFDETNLVIRKMNQQCNVACSSAKDLL